MRSLGYLITAVIALVISAGCTAIDNNPTTPGDVVTTNDIDATTVDTSPPGDRADVSRVLDGDSLFVSLDDGSEAEIRMLGINSPEGSECHGDVARDTLEQLLSSGTLTLVADTEDTDQFGRLLRYLYVDGLNVNLALLANGDATVLQGDHSLDTEFAAISDAAYDNGLGMWSADACGDTATVGQITIVDYVYNPSGRDEDDLNGEWVAIANEGSSTADLTEWVLRDESTQNRFVFPKGTILEPGRELLVHVGCGNDTSTDLYWCANDPIWSNGGDTAILQMPSGSVVDRERFQGDF